MPKNLTVLPAVAFAVCLVWGALRPAWRHAVEPSAAQLNNAQQVGWLSIAGKDVPLLKEGWLHSPEPPLCEECSSMMGNTMYSASLWCQMDVGAVTVNCIQVAESEVLFQCQFPGCVYNPFCSPDIGHL